MLVFRKVLRTATHVFDGILITIIIDFSPNSVRFYMRQFARFGTIRTI